MERKNRKLGLILAIFMFSISTFSFQKLTTIQMRENTIKINALEIDDFNVEVSKDIKITLDDRTINFDFNKYTVKSNNSVLQNLVKYIKENNYKVNIIGHTDSYGSDDYNKNLSLKRAKAVRDKLIEFGLEKNRIVSISGEGEKYPIATNDTKEGRLKNRRVEFILEKIKLGDKNE